ATPEARAILESLTPEQREIFSAAQAMRERVNATLQAYGVDVRMVETETGGFWSRRVKGREVEGRIIEKNRAGRSRRLGGDRIGSRTQASAMQGAEEGIIYDDPWEALRGEFRNKLKMAQDQYLADLIQPLAQPKALAGFGYRPLAMNHPALDKVRFAGTTDSGGVMLGTERPVFENEVADELDKLFDARRERDTPTGGAIAAVNAVLTPLRASADA